MKNCRNCTGILILPLKALVTGESSSSSSGGSSSSSLIDCRPITISGLGTRGSPLISLPPNSFDCSQSNINLTLHFHEKLNNATGYLDVIYKSVIDNGCNNWGRWTLYGYFTGDHIDVLPDGRRMHRPKLCALKQGTYAGGPNQILTSFNYDFSALKSESFTRENCDNRSSSSSSSSSNSSSSSSSSSNSSLLSSKYYIQGKAGFPFGLDTLNSSGELIYNNYNLNDGLSVGYFGFQELPFESGYSFRIWKGSDFYYGDNNGDGIADVYGNWKNFGIVASGKVTAKITFDSGTLAYTLMGTPSTASINFVSDNSSIIGSVPSNSNNASLNLYYNGWIWEKSFIFDTTQTINFRIVAGGGSYYGDNNQDGIATINQDPIPLNVQPGVTYTFQAMVFAKMGSSISSGFPYRIKAEPLIN